MGVSVDRLWAGGVVVSGIASLSQYILRRQLLVITYHRIRDERKHSCFMFDDDTFSCSAGVFDAQVRTLTRSRRVVTLPEVVEALDQGRELPDHATLITFDDGAADNHEVALPILKRYGASAVFFVPTLMLIERRTGWWDTIAYVLKTAPAGQYMVDIAGNAVNIDLTSRAMVTRSIRVVLGAVKKARDIGYQDLEARICAITGGQLPSRAEQSSQLMTAEQVRELVHSGMSVGGHSHTHQILAQLSEQSQRDELTVSKAILEDITGVPVLALAYPVGGQGHYTAETCGYAREAGYLCGFNFRQPGGFADLSRVDRYDIPRIGANPRSGTPFLAQMCGVDWAHARKSIAGGS